MIDLPAGLVSIAERPLIRAARELTWRAPLRRESVFNLSPSCRPSVGVPKLIRLRLPAELH